jgi:predicted alpha/beta superfamily hydrolase
MNSPNVLKKRNSYFFLSAIILITILSQFSCELDTLNPQTPSTSETILHRILHSEIVGDDYDIYLRLPPNYQKENGPYPVIFQLDPQWHFDITTKFVSDFEQNKQSVPVIVVGIGYPYPSGDTNPKGRNRDYTLPLENKNYPLSAEGGAVNFYQFIKKELIPFLELNYSIAGPEHRSISGHSYGGLFVLYALSQYDSSSPCISSFLAASPSIWYGDGSIYNYLLSLKSKYTDIPVKLYMSVGDLEDVYMTANFDTLSNQISSSSYKELQYKFEKFHADHVGTVDPSYRNGIPFLLEH